MAKSGTSSPRKVVENFLLSTWTSIKTFLKISVSLYKVSAGVGITSDLTVL